MAGPDHHRLDPIQRQAGFRRGSAEAGIAVKVGIGMIHQRVIAGVTFEAGPIRTPPAQT